MKRTLAILWLLIMVIGLFVVFPVVMCSWKVCFLFWGVVLGAGIWSVLTSIALIIVLEE